MPGFKPGDELRYCHEGADRRAQVSEVDGAGNVIGIGVLAGGPTHYHVEFGVTPPKLKQAKAPTDRITDGFYWKQG